MDERSTTTVVALAVAAVLAVAVIGTGLWLVIPRDDGDAAGPQDAGVDSDPPAGALVAARDDVGDVDDLTGQGRDAPSLDVVWAAVSRQGPGLRVTVKMRDLRAAAPGTPDVVVSLKRPRVAVSTQARFFPAQGRASTVRTTLGSTRHCPGSLNVDRGHDVMWTYVGPRCLLHGRLQVRASASATQGDRVVAEDRLYVGRLTVVDPG